MFVKATPQKVAFLICISFILCLNDCIVKVFFYICLTQTSKAETL